MFGERIEAHGFANTITIWVARQSCRMIATCMTAASFPDARYITWHGMEVQQKLPDDAKMDLFVGAYLCRHRPGIWNSLSADQFGEQTYIKKGKMPGGLKGLTMSEDQLLCDIVWPCAGSDSDLANSMKYRLGRYQLTEVLVIFDRYDDRSAKDHERIRCAGEGSVNYNITTSSKLPCRDAIMKSKANKKALVRVLSHTIWATT